MRENSFLDIILTGGCGQVLVKFVFGSDPKLLKGNKCDFHYKLLT